MVNHPSGEKMKGFEPEGGHGSRPCYPSNYFGEAKLACMSMN